MHDEHTESHPGSILSYIVGFILSLLLTIIPLFIVLNHTFSRTVLIYSILVMAFLQFLIQLIFFMHVKEGEKPHYNVLALIFAAVFVIAIVAGTAWVMTFNSQVQ